ncbi:tetratricopeptide repeat protein [Myxococcus sp. AB036A]|uniref:tetratricopeptide repeat protein n=1 Tax=Myxococcus sp. AB036A TaxID=2562793 RepID=UPI00114789CC
MRRRRRDGCGAKATLRTMPLLQGTEAGGRAGRLADAIERYRRALEFDPKNADAVRSLKELEQPAAKAP